MEMDSTAILNGLIAGLSVKAPELALWTASIAGYCLLIYHFYRFAAKRDIFGFNALKIELDRNDLSEEMRDTLYGAIKYGVMFPVIVFLWFTGFSILLFFLAKELPTAQILLISVSFVTAIRLASYYHEDLSRDMAKLFPFVLLGIAIVEPGFFSLELIVNRINSLLDFLPDLPVYFFFIVLVEWALRVLLALKHIIFGTAAPDKN